MERDYQKDLEVCEKATEGPWEWIEDKFWGGYSGIVGKDDKEVLYPDHANDGDDGAAWFEEYPNEADRVFIVTARTALPWYIKRCMALENELQTANQAIEKLQSQLHQCREREAYYREQLQNIHNFASRSMDGTPDMDNIVIETEIALDYYPPSQPSNLDSEGVET